jgi:ABC-type nitrate/sulfonate/bicarbonate transport system substrate-binding protein
MEQNVNVEKSTEINDQQAYEMAIEFANRPENKERIMSKFTKAFGKDKNVRTRKQWANLVRVYGVDKVAELEQMSKEEVQYKCLTLTQRLNAKAKL